MAPSLMSKLRRLAPLTLAGALSLAAFGAQAAFIPPALSHGASVAEPAAGGCGAGRHRLLTGGCSVRPYNREQSQYLNDLRPCQPGTHSESFPSPQGYRCVLNR